MEKQELKHLWDQKYNSPYFENILQIGSLSINYINGQQQKVSIYDLKQSGSVTMMTPTNITSTSTPKDNLNQIIPP